MEHAEARELLLTAAVEPDGLDRLIAGDTSEAASLAGHLVDCSECTAEMERLRRDSTVLRAVVRSLPPPELRERTLAFVGAVGRDRTAGGGAFPVAAATLPGVATRRPAGIERTGLWAAAVAAVLLVAIGATALLVGASRDQVIATQANQIAALGRIATATLRIDGQPDARHVDLVSSGELDANGSILYSPGTRELVILTEGLPTAPAGQEYRCWVEIDGERTRIGRMFFAGAVAFWVGDVQELPAGEAAVRFGVTLAPAEGDSVEGEPVLAGES
ncbi:MAG TPA: anti-sigma factor [Candidatus Limnocylindrales bacterium]|nr:anti-sigma factor [Candidatus Limnocylindrales bacterium]